MYAIVTRGFVGIAPGSKGDPGVDTLIPYPVRLIAVTTQVPAPQAIVAVLPSPQAIVTVVKP